MVASIHQKDLLHGFEAADHGERHEVIGVCRGHFAELVEAHECEPLDVPLLGVL